MAGYGRILSIARSNYRNLLSSSNGVLNAQPCATLKSKTMDKLGVPPRPKKPLSPFFKFMQNERIKLLTQNPNLTCQHTVKKLSQMWATCDQDEKNKLQHEYDLEVIDYTKKVMTWEESITPEQKNLIKEEKKRLKQKAQKDLLKKRTEFFGKPKKPPSAFINFMQEKSVTKNKDVKINEWVSTIASDWRSMSDDEKFKYREESKKLMEQYKGEMKGWEQKMVRMGNIELVRNRGLINIKANIVPESQ